MTEKEPLTARNTLDKKRADAIFAKQDAIFAARDAAHEKRRAKRSARHAKEEAKAATKESAKLTTPVEREQIKRLAIRERLAHERLPEPTMAQARTLAAKERAKAKQLAKQIEKDLKKKAAFDRLAHERL